MQEIFNRRSVRHFKQQPVEAQKIDQLLRAAMQAPSAANQQAWEFIVVQDRQSLVEVAQTSPYAKPAAEAAVAFILLADENKLKVPTAWEQDLAAAAENLLLEAVHLGLGAVWLGAATSDIVMKNLRSLFNLPETLRPFAIIAAGYPDGPQQAVISRYQAQRVHYERW
ncbi:MAG: nitroreductase family protein [Oscillospiraceae bacterium]|nr:nitroreductase family protein [Oscillospiraceae bacterium]MDD4368363.1 nitroreductase family protein [Oscillospiraceae bacterium]